MQIRTASAVVGLAVSAAAHAGLVVDQVGAPFVSGGLGGPVAQSFTPTTGQLAAIEIFVSGTGALTTDATVTVFGTWSGGSTPVSLSDELGSKTLTDLPRGQAAVFAFDAPIETTPERAYYFLVEFTDALVAGAARGNPYDRGMVLFGGGNISGADLVFTTYTVPAPGAALPMLGLAFAAWRRR